MKNLVTLFSIYLFSTVSHADLQLKRLLDIEASKMLISLGAKSIFCEDFTGDDGYPTENGQSCNVNGNPVERYMAVDIYKKLQKNGLVHRGYFSAHNTIEIHKVSCAEELCSVVYEYSTQFHAG